MIRFCLVVAGAICGGLAAEWSTGARLIQQPVSDDPAATLLKYVSQYATPEGQLAAGLELLNSGFDASSQLLYEDTKSLHAELASAIDLIAEVVSAVLQDELYISEQKRQVLIKEIQEVAVQLNDLTLSCVSHPSCHSCSEDIACVWCLSQSQCVSGDEFGPTHSECEDFLFKSCPQSLCEEYNSCEECLITSDCSWCEASGKCGRSGNVYCELSFLFTARNGQSCPMSPQRVAVRSLAFSLPDSPRDELRVQRLALEKSAAKFRDQSNQLQSTLAKLADSQSVIKSFLLSNEYSYTDLVDLAYYTDELATAEGNCYTQTRKSERRRRKRSVRPQKSSPKLSWIT